MTRYRIVATGKVQGVFFRANTKKAADELGLKGWVRNTENGDVEILVEGDDDSLKKFIDFCKIGPPMSRVDDLKIEREDAKPEFLNFTVKH